MGIDKDGVLGGVTSGAFRQEPWHGYGESRNSKGELVGTKRPIPESIRTGRELLVTAGLDWEAKQENLSTLIPNIGAEDYSVVTRGDTGRVLGIHSDRYGLVQHSVLGDYAQAIMDTRQDAFPVSAVELWNGRVIFLVLEFADEVKVVRKDGDSTDTMTRYMGLYTSHDGSHPVAVKFMSTLWVCQNTFTPWNAHTGFTVKHTSNASDIAKDATEALRMMTTSFATFDEEVARLLAIPADKRTMTDGVLPRLFGKRPSDEGRGQTLYDNKWDEVLAEWTEATRQESAWDCVMAVQGYEQHRSHVRNTTRDMAVVNRLLRDDFPMTRKAHSLFV